MIEPPPPETFLSGESGTRTGPRRVVTGAVADAATDVLQWVTRVGRPIDRLADAEPRRRVLVVSIYRSAGLLRQAVRELSSSRHGVELAFGAVGEANPALASDTVVDRLDGGKFENLNHVLRELRSGADFDWAIVLDDDVVLPRRFLDRFLAVCGRFEFELAQPALTRRSHAAWRVTRRRPLSLARETNFVEIGPVTAFGRAAAAEFLPFPELRFGWGLDLHWSALAAARGWRVGIVDVVPVRHEHDPVAHAYDRSEAVREAQRFLARHAYLPASAAQQTLVTHRRVPPAR